MFLVRFVHEFLVYVHFVNQPYSFKILFAVQQETYCSNTFFCERSHFINGFINITVLLAWRSGGSAWKDTSPNLASGSPFFFSARIGQVQEWSLRQCYVCCVTEPFSIQHCWKAVAGAVKVFFESGRTRGLRKRTKMVLVESNLYATEVILPRAKSDVENTFFYYESKQGVQT